MKLPNWLTGAEGRSSLAKPATWLIESLTGGAKSISGVSINERNALTIAAVWACVRVISETIASLPLFIYRRNPDTRDRSVDSGNPLFDLLHSAPNADMTSMLFRETMTAHVLTWGNAYAQIERSAGGVPVALWPIHPSTIEIHRNVDGRLLYVVTDAATRNVIDKIASMNMLHIAGPSPDGIIGYSPIAQARESLGLAKAGERYASAVFGNNSRPSGVLEHPHKMKPETVQQLRKDWEATYGGPEKAAKTAILEEGMQFKTLSFPPQDAQMLSSRQFAIEEIARWFNVPPHRIQHLERATFSNIDSQQISFATDTIRPWLVRWEQEFQRKLFDRDPDVFAEFVIDGLLRGDPKARSESLQIQFQNGALTQNEWRAIENRNSFEGGDKHYVPLNFAAVEDGGNDDDTPAPDDDSDRSVLLDGLVKAHKPLLAHSIGRLLRTESDKVRRAQKRESDFGAWVQRFYGDHRSHVRGELIPAIDAFVDAARSLLGTTSESAADDSAVGTITDELAQRHVDASVEQLGAGLDAALASWRDNDARANDDAGRAMFDLIAFVRGNNNVAT